MVCVALTLVSCKKNSDILTVKVDNSAIGKAGEVMLVMDRALWDTLYQDSVKAVLNQPQPFLNQDVAMFDVLQLDNDLFYGNKLNHFNIIHFELDTTRTEPLFSLERDTWVKPQVYVHIKAATQEQALSVFMENQEDILAELYDNDIRKIQNANESKLNVAVQEKIRTKFGILLSVPKEYNLARETDDFIWLRYPTVKNDRFIMIYTSPTTQVTPANMIDNRNRISAKYIEEKENPDARPVVVQQFGLPFTCPLQIGAHQGMEMRGLWEQDLDYMGGSFYHFSFVNDQNITVSIDGFVYAPRDWTEKRDYLRQVEAIVKSVK